MPIYAYRCEHCGHAQDVLQKVSDPVLTVCPACGQPTYRKQVTAAGFQLKGSGWYATDFKGDKKPAAKSSEAAEGTGAGKDGATKVAGDGASNGASASADAKGDGAKGDGAKADGAKAAAPAPAPASKPAAPKTGEP